MAQAFTYPDTIFDLPCFNEFPVKAAADTIKGGRLMSSAPHIDGLYIIGAIQADRDSANLLTTRNGAGDWTLNRTAAGAETFNIRANLAQLLRTGETYVTDTFNEDNKVAAPDKGIAITDFFVISKCGVVALTSATLRLGKTVYSTTAAAPGAAPTQTDLVAATAVQTATSANYVFQKVAGPANLTFHINDLGLIEIEYHVVMANTGTLAVAALGCHASFNYN